MRNRIYSLLALLLMGSASIMAENDPFGDYNPYSFVNNMILVGSVYLNGEKLGMEAVVAAYCGTTLRGKQNPDKDGILSLSIGGDNSGDKLHFKVFTDGRVIEVDQNLIYTNNGSVGTYEEPYAINLPTPVVIKPSAEGWATVCLPFNAEVPKDVTVYDATAIENSELVMTQVMGKILPSNTPVLVKSEGSTNYEWLSRVADGDITTTGNILVGTTTETTVSANSVLTLGYSKEGNHELGFWLYTGNTIPANRAYITNFPLNSRGMTFRFDVTIDIQEIVNRKYENSKCFDLQGHCVNGQPSKVNGPFKNGRQGQIIIIKP